MEGQYLGPTAVICPEYIGDKSILSSIILCVFMFVFTTQEGRFGGEKLLVRNDVGLGEASPNVLLITEKFIVDLFRRGGVPVFKRPTRNPRLIREAVRSLAASSPILPAEDRFVPT